MADLHVAPVMLKVLRYQTSVTVFGGGLTAKQAVIACNGFAHGVFVPALTHELQEVTFIGGPVALLLLIFLSRRRASPCLRSSHLGGPDC